MCDIYGSQKAKDYILIGFTFSFSSQSFVYMRIIQNIVQYISKTEAMICALLTSVGIDQALAIGGSCPILKHLDSCTCSKIPQIVERRRIHS
jgi:hypothetical protein